MARITTTMTKSGPFFERDPEKTFADNVLVMFTRIAEEGESDIKAQLQAHESSRSPVYALSKTARVSERVVGRVVSLSGTRWRHTAVVSVVRKDLLKQPAIALFAAAAEIERRDHVFRRTTTRLRSVKKMNLAELLKGLQ